ncbi:hypothetical protein BC629DRAFT_1720723 [Irpex lacteus]|nr:hypothetical protein BC629DRAFT_1720723 [Irpex lacteus]
MDSEDVLLLVFRSLAIGDILAANRVCKLWARACRAKQLWIHVWCRDVLRQRLPVPANIQPLDLMNEVQAKSIVIHVLRLQHSLSRSNEQRRPFHRVSIALSRNGSEDPIAEVYLDGPVHDGLVDLYNDRGIVIAVELQCSRPQLEIMYICVHEGSPRFIRLARFPGLLHIRALYGSLLGFSLHGDLSVPSVLNWHTGQITHLRDRPSIYGCSHSMAIDGEYIAFLDNISVWIARYSPSETTVLSLHDSVAVEGLRDIGYAKLALSGDKGYRTLRACVADDNGLFVYTIPLSYTLATHNNISSQLIWSRAARVFGYDYPFCIIRPHLGRSATTFSWLEGHCGTFHLSEITPMRFVTITEELQDTDQSSSRQPPTFVLSEIDMPALYAMSVRDYDDGLGILAIGNIMGEVAIYSLAGDDVGSVGQCLRPIVFSTWSGHGEELIPAAPIPSCPLPPFYYHAPRDWLQQKKDIVHTWDQHWPDNFLVLPEGWKRDNWFHDGYGYLFLDQVGDKSWEINHACHFLGPVMPLLYYKPRPSHDICSHFLCKDCTTLSSG